MSELLELLEKNNYTKLEALWLGSWMNGKDTPFNLKLGQKNRFMHDRTQAISLYLFTQIAAKKGEIDIKKALSQPSSPMNRDLEIIIIIRRRCCLGLLESRL